MENNPRNKRALTDFLTIMRSPIAEIERLTEIIETALEYMKEPDMDDDSFILEEVKKILLKIDN